MAYQRYSLKSDWYIFWEASPATCPDDQRLAIWHIDHRATGPSISYREARDMLAKNDFSRIPGYSDRDMSLVREAIEAFVADVDEEYRQSR